LSDNRYDVLGFSDAGDAEAWLDEDTPEVAIVDGDEDPRRMGIGETLRGRGVMLIPAG